jgi:hypothetical protein
MEIKVNRFMLASLVWILWNPKGGVIKEAAFTAYFSGDSAGVGATAVFYSHRSRSVNSYRLLIVFCGIGKIEPNGDLFKHLRD